MQNSKSQNLKDQTVIDKTKQLFQLKGGKITDCEYFFPEQNPLTQKVNTVPQKERINDMCGFMLQLIL